MSAVEFNFIGFCPDEALRRDASSALEHLIERAPYGSRQVALLEKTTGTQGDRYRCAVEVYTRFGPFIAHAQKATAEDALASVEQALLRKIQVWAQRRFRTKGGQADLLQSA